MKLLFRSCLKKRKKEKQFCLLTFEVFSCVGSHVLDLFGKKEKRKTYLCTHLCILRLCWFSCVGPVLRKKEKHICVLTLNSAPVLVFMCWTCWKKEKHIDVFTFEFCSCVGSHVLELLKKEKHIHALTWNPAPVWALMYWTCWMLDYCVC